MIRKKFDNKEFPPDWKRERSYKFETLIIMTWLTELFTDIVTINLNQFRRQAKGFVRYH